MENKLYVLGAGPGNIEQVTPAVQAAAAACRVVACAKRHLNIVKDHPNVLEMKNFSETFDMLREELKLGSAALLLSGDTGIFSLLPIIKKNFDPEDVVVLPGISSLQVLCAKVAETWQNSVILSGHGRNISDTKILDSVEHNRSVIFFCDREKNPSWICGLLDNAGLGGVTAIVGERLGAEEERISRGMASDFINDSFDELSIVLLINEGYTEQPHLLPEDAEFLRADNIPMTHEEVRAVIMAKLSLRREDVLWDIGAGSGSISVTAAPLCREVHAVEQNSSAAELVRSNCIKFRRHNIKVYDGSAVDVIDSLPVPDVVFIGGSGDEFIEILKKISSVEREIHLVVSAVSLKTIADCSKELSKEGFKNFNAVQLAVSKVKTVGRTRIWQAQNPVAIFSADTRGKREANE